MVRIGAVALMAVSLFMLLGCGEKSTETTRTGVDLSFRNCLSFEAWVWIDQVYVGSFTSDLPSFIEYKSGSHTIYAKSNLIAGDTCYCWTKTFSVSDGKATSLILDCIGAGCCK
jgi:hypothetical protein